MSLNVESLTKQYGEQKAIDDISFRVEPGEVVGFLGPNGAGKSTTMKILSCYILPTSGEASVCGFDIYQESVKVRERIGYLPEHNPLYEEMYIKEYLSFVAQLHGIRNKKERIREMIDITGLQAEVHKKIGQLSKGYRQRLGLAQAMIHDPEVLILDEPTSGLDPNQIVEIREVINELGKEKTVLLSTHIMQEVQAVCNRVLIINKGQIVADDEPEDLVERFGGGKRVKVLFKHSVDEADLKKVEGVSSVTSSGDYWILESQSDADIREKLFSFSVNQNNSILELSQEEMSLEEIFHQLTADQGKETTKNA